MRSQGREEIIDELEKMPNDSHPVSNCLAIEGDRVLVRVDDGGVRGLVNQRQLVEIIGGQAHPLRLRLTVIKEGGLSVKELAQWNESLWRATANMTSSDWEHSSAKKRASSSQSVLSVTFDLA